MCEPKTVYLSPSTSDINVKFREVFEIELSENALILEVKLGSIEDRIASMTPTSLNPVKKTIELFFAVDNFRITL